MTLVEIHIPEIYTLAPLKRLTDTVHFAPNYKIHLTKQQHHQQQQSRTLLTPTLQTQTQSVQKGVVHKNITLHNDKLLSFFLIS